jgi:murein DD-endopeptidase MepM/ murein hydrolase activator NlpD
MLPTSFRVCAGAGLGVLSASNAWAQTPMPPDSMPTGADLVFTAPKDSPAEAVKPAPKAVAPPERLPTAVATPLQVDRADAFIDRTDYSLGATQPLPERPVSQASTITPEPVVSSQRIYRTEAAIRPEQRPRVEVTAAVGWKPPEVQIQPESSPEPQSVVQPGRPYFPPGLVKQALPESLALIAPVAIPALITSPFGWRVHPISGVARLHAGTDIGAPMGTPVLAAATGKVMLADHMGGYGLVVALEHQQGMRQTLYAHLSELFVKPGELVQQGAVIGRVGSTGASTGPHLHFELRQMTSDGWVAVDAGQPVEAAMGQLAQILNVFRGRMPVAVR